MRVRWLPLALLLAGPAACAPATLYTPTAAVAPMFEKAGQFQTSVHGGPLGGQINVAYTPAPNLMVRASGHSQNRDDGHYHLISAGAGWFLALTPRRADLFRGFRGAAAVDFGFADAVGTGTSTGAAPVQRYYSAALYRISMQADLGVAFKYVELSGVARLVYLNVAHHDDSDAGGNATADWWLFEPAGVLRVGVPTFKVEAQLGWSEPYSQSGFVGDYRRWYWTVGVVAAL